MTCCGWLTFWDRGKSEAPDNAVINSILPLQPFIFQVGLGAHLGAKLILETKTAAPTLRRSPADSVGQVPVCCLPEVVTPVVTGLN